MSENFANSLISIGHITKGQIKYIFSPYSIEYDKLIQNGISYSQPQRQWHQSIRYITRAQLGFISTDHTFLLQWRPANINETICSEDMAWKLNKRCIVSLDVYIIAVKCQLVRTVTQNHQTISMKNKTKYKRMRNTSPTKTVSELKCSGRVDIPCSKMLNRQYHS